MNNTRGLSKNVYSESCYTYHVRKNSLDFCNGRALEPCSLSTFFVMFYHAHVRLWSYRNKFEFSRTFGQQKYVILRQYFYCTDTVGRGVSGGSRGAIVSGTVCPLLRLYVCFFSFFHFEPPAAHKKRCYNGYKKQVLPTLSATSRKKYVFDLQVHNHAETCSSKLKHTTTKQQ